MRSATEMYERLVEEVNLALRRPGMFGGEIAIRSLFAHLTFLEECETEWNQDFDRLREGDRWGALGVRGAFMQLLPGDDDLGAVSSVYAEFARKRVWLSLDRELGVWEYAEMRELLDDWCTEDRNWQEVITKFGPASVLFGGTNPYYPKTLGYATRDPSDPMISFHLWNGTDPGDDWPPKRPDPALLAVRVGNVPFDECFTFTPEGLQRRTARD
jgi:hypothetical protein